MGFVGSLYRRGGGGEGGGREGFGMCGVEIFGGNVLW